MLRSCPLVMVLAFAVAPAIAQEVPFSVGCFRPDRRGAQSAYERSLNEAANPESLRAFHDRLASEPHLAGSEGDLRMIEYITGEFQKFGLEVETHWIWPYLSKPVAAELEIVSPTHVLLDITEPSIDADPDTKHPNLTFGFSAFSGSGDVTGEVVYANYGRKEDFEKLKSLGVVCAGKVVVTRFGGNFRGYKAKFAEEAGAAALVIYTDPADSGYMRGLMYPEGGWASEKQIQRGTMATMPYWGDPLTPNTEANENAKRLDPSEVELPTIPIQPVGWGAAQQILERMQGAGVPDESWQGAMPFPYRLTGGPELRVRVMVKQERGLTRTANVVGTLRGTKYPDEYVIIGCHHDAWGFGAADPTAGTHILMESARVFGEAAKRGERPERTIIFGAWAAEEHGIVGSSEWVEANIDRLMKGGVAYFNLDMAAMGPLFNASGAPTLATLIVDATRDVPQARDAERTVYTEWTTRKGAMDAASVVDPVSLVGTMGGGSDHVGFYFHACIPSASVGGGGSRGTSYHSNYDTLHWYRKVVGEDYEPSLMVVRVLNTAVGRLARGDVLPIDPRGIGPAVRKHLDDLEKKAKAAGMALDVGDQREFTKSIDARAILLSERMIEQAESLQEERLSQLNEALLTLERAWFVKDGLPERSWLRSAFMAPDKDSGYASWPLPQFRDALERKDKFPAIHEARGDLHRCLDAARRKVTAGLHAFGWDIEEF